MYIKKKIALLKGFFFSPNENGNVIYFKGEKKTKKKRKETLRIEKAHHMYSAITFLVVSVRLRLRRSERRDIST